MVEDGEVVEGADVVEELVEHHDDNSAEVHFARVVDN